MKCKTMIMAVAIVMGSCLTANASPITYRGSLVSGAPVTGSVGGFSYFFEDVASGIDFWSFSALGGQHISLLGTRLNNNLDLAFSLYRGVTSADSSLFSAFSDWGGLIFLAAADDEIPNPGPGGDPYLANFVVPVTGMYTIAIGGSLSTDAGHYPYRLALTVPEPSTLLLLFGALFAGSVVRRKLAPPRS